MKQYYKVDEWNVIEEGFDPSMHESSESMFSIGNGKMGQRAMFEEFYSGKSLEGSYIAGIYYPDKTRVGWWKNGYPEYFAKVLNSPNWLGVDIHIGTERLDLNVCKVRKFERKLDMQHSILSRSFIATFPSGKEIEVQTERFVSRVDDEIGCIRYGVKALNFNDTITCTTSINANVKNKDSNYDEVFWDRIEENIKGEKAFLGVRTRKLGFEVYQGFKSTYKKNGAIFKLVPTTTQKEKFVSFSVATALNENETFEVQKYVSVVSSMYYSDAQLKDAANQKLDLATAKGYDQLRSEHAVDWEQLWEQCDVQITGDVAAQQAIRFNILQLNQTYTGRDHRLNIGPKGFTGEKYGGSTYWDTEAYCIPFYLGTNHQKVARQLLQYRYNHLPKAIENAEKLGFKNGAALYPMVTMNGEECHNEWEITFEEIHRNGAIAYAIYNYINYTGDASYLWEGGSEILIGIARFWAQRVHWSDHKKQYVMHGVTGPNEYENNINNNWYTNYIACWCMQYAALAIEEVKEHYEKAYEALVIKTKLNEAEELKQWKHICDNMYYPQSEELNIFLQQEGYLDKEQILAANLDPKERPINQKWSWDRILRSCFIKQADVLQGIYFFEDHFDIQTLKSNFDYYEPRTVHESSLSPCVHAILAAKLGYEEKAYQMYLRTSRLDLDDYNHEAHEGLHITSMAGTWMSVVQGFGGMRVIEGKLHFAPMIPTKWESFAFNIRFRGRVVKVVINKQDMFIELLSGDKIDVVVNNTTYTVAEEQTAQILHHSTH
ncbi:MAG: family 65 glycosyl hydrolase domain-containing protein [Bacteroidota bacterium]